MNDNEIQEGLSWETLNLATTAKECRDEKDAGDKVGYSKRLGWGWGWVGYSKRM